MRSFAEYKKEQLQDAIEEITLQEGLLKHFEILRLSLLEAIKLPFVPQQTILAEVQYDQSRKEDYLINSAFINEIINECKLHFYNELMAEADASFNAGNELNQFKMLLNNRVSDFIRDLRQVVAAAINNARDTGDTDQAVGDQAFDQAAGAQAAGAQAAGAQASDQAVGAQAAGAQASDQAVGAQSAGSRLTGRQPQNVSMDTSFDVGAGMGTSGVYDNQAGVDREGNPLDPYPRWRADRGVTRPKQGGFQPAAMGKLRPSDGVFAGLGRIARRVTRPLRRVWHGDPTRQMAKEHHEALNTLFLENWQAVNDLVDKFEVEIKAFINKQLDQIIAKLGVRPSPTTDGGGAPGDPQGATPVGTVVAPEDVATGAPAVDDELDKAAQQATDLAQRQGKSPEEVEQDVEKAVGGREEELVALGASRIGIKVNLARRQRTLKSGDVKEGVAKIPNAKAFVDSQTGEPLAKGYAGVLKEVVNRLYKQLQGMDPRYSEYTPKSKGNIASRTQEVERLLGFTESPQSLPKKVWGYLAAVEIQLGNRVIDPKRKRGEAQAARGEAQAARGAPTAAATATLEPADALAVGDKVGQSQAQPIFSNAKEFMSYVQQNHPEIMKWAQRLSPDNLEDGFGDYLEDENNETPEAALENLISDYRKLNPDAAGTEVLPNDAGTEVLPNDAGTEVLPNDAGTEAPPDEIPAAVIATIDDYKNRMSQKGIELDVPDDTMKKLLSQFAQAKGETLGELEEEDAKEFFGNHLVPWVAKNHPEWMQKWEVDEESVMASVQELEQQLKEKGYPDSKIRVLVKDLMDTLDSEGPEVAQKKIDDFMGESRRLEKEREAQGESEELTVGDEDIEKLQGREGNIAAMRKEAFARKLKDTMKSLFS